MKYVIELLSTLKYKGNTPGEIGFLGDFDIVINNLDETVEKFWIFSDKIFKKIFYTTLLNIVDLLRKKYFR